MFKCVKLALVKSSGFLSALGKQRKICYWWMLRSLDFRFFRYWLFEGLSLVISSAFHIAGKLKSGSLFNVLKWWGGT